MMYQTLSLSLEKYMSVSKEDSHIPAVLITGGTSGLGLELAKILAADGLEVYAMGREARENFPKTGNLHFVKTDFSDLKQVRRSVNDLLDNDVDFDYIVSNAGVLNPPDFTVTADGFEYGFQVNFLSHLLINDLFLKNIKRGVFPKILFVTSPVYKYVKPSFSIPTADKYNAFRGYSESKFYLLLLGKYFELKFPGLNLRYSGFNPGTFRSGIHRMQMRWFGVMYRVGAPFMKNPAKVARSLACILRDNSIQDRVIFHHSRRRYTAGIGLTPESEKFLLACQEAVDIVG